MLYYLFVEVLRPYFHAFNVFRYITVRTAYASLTALLLTLVLGPWVIRKLREMQIGQFIREEGPKSHKKKAGTPTMGGVLIIIATIVPTLLWADLTSCIRVAGHGRNGGVRRDRIRRRLFKGFRAAQQRALGAGESLALQILVSLAAGVALIALTGQGAYSTQLVVPFFKKFHPGPRDSYTLLGHAYLWPLAFIPLLAFVAHCDCGFIERGEPNRRAGWLSDWLHGSCRREHLLC